MPEIKAVDCIYEEYLNDNADDFIEALEDAGRAVMRDGEPFYDGPLWVMLDVTHANPIPTRIGVHVNHDYMWCVSACLDGITRTFAEEAWESDRVIARYRMVPEYCG